MDQDQQPAADPHPFANSQRATDDDVARLAGGATPRPAATGATASSGGGADHQPDPSPFANSEQATPEEVAERAAQSPSRLNEGDR